MIEFILIVVVLLLLIGIFVRSGRGKRRQRGLPCPYCREPMDNKATVCAGCGRESKSTTRWDRRRAKPH
jgi:predicted amidophosphoribosyltransferase